jgi:hypothetical protein
MRYWRDLERLPRIPTTFVLGAVSIFAMFALLPSVDRFGYLIGVLTVDTILTIAEVTVGHH